MRYANEETVYRLLDIDPLDTDAGTLLDIENVEEGVAATIDAKCNRTFGVAPQQQTRIVSVFPQDLFTPRYGGIDRVYIGDQLYFFFNQIISPNTYLYTTPIGMRNITSVVYGGTWNGTTYTDQVTAAASDWISTFVDQRGWSHGITLPYNLSSIRVTAEWEDQSSSATVPPEIREAATFITVDEYRIRHQSPAGEIGPPGLATFLRNAWEFEMVKTAIARNTFRQIVA